MTVTVTPRRPAAAAHAFLLPTVREIPPVQRPGTFDSTWWPNRPERPVEPPDDEPSIHARAADAARARRRTEPDPPLSPARLISALAAVLALAL